MTKTEITNATSNTNFSAIAASTTSAAISNS